MDRVATRIVLGMLGVLALGQLCAGCEAPTPEAIEVKQDRPSAYPAAVVPVASVAVQAEAPRVSLDLPNTCDPLVAVRGKDGVPRVTKRAPAWLRSNATRSAHQAEVREVIAVVVEEMGGDPLAAEFLWRKAILESSGNAGAVHWLDVDQAAGRRTARRGRGLSSVRWREATVPVLAEVRGHEVVVDRVDAWMIGRGLYGMNTGLFLARWSNDAPPWSLCDPVVATVTAIWSMRAGLRRCRTDRLRDAYRWISAGQCSKRSPEKERIFDRLARGHVRGLSLGRFDPDARADFGDRWPQETSDPAQVLGAVRWRLSRP